MNANTKTVYFVTCPDDFESGGGDGGNPRLDTSSSIETMEGVAPLLPKNPSAVIAGTGTRHYLMYYDLRRIRGWDDSAFQLHHNRLVGAPDLRRGNEVLLASGRRVPAADYDESGVEPGLIRLLNDAPHDTVLLCDPGLLWHIGEPGALWGQVYQVTMAVKDTPLTLGDVEITLLEPLDIKPATAADFELLGVQPPDQPATPPATTLTGETPGQQPIGALGNRRSRFD